MRMRRRRLGAEKELQQPFFVEPGVLFKTMCTDQVRGQSEQKEEHVLNTGILAETGRGGTSMWVQMTQDEDC